MQIIFRRRIHHLVTKLLWLMMGAKIKQPRFDCILVCFSSPEPKAHRWAYRILMVRRPSVVVRRSQCSKIFFSKMALPIKAKFYVEPPWVGGTIFCAGHRGHMTKMAATPIYGQNPSKIFFSRTGKPISTKLGM